MLAEKQKRIEEERKVQDEIKGMKREKPWPSLYFSVLDSFLHFFTDTKRLKAMNENEHRPYKPSPATLICSQDETRSEKNTKYQKSRLIEFAVLCDGWGCSHRMIIQIL